MKKEYLSELLEKYAQGQCTPDEEAYVDKWFASLDTNPDDTRLSDISEQHLLGQKMLERIKARVMPDQVQSSSWGTTRFYKIAATLLLLAVAGVGIWMIRNNSVGLFNGQLASSGSGKIFITNTSNEVRHQRLSDGSVISLQPNGSIQFPKEFANNKREVQLTGEAFFEVSKDKHRPFIITTKDVTVKVLGTSFNVKAYDGAEEVTVAVRTGKVSVFAKTAMQLNRQSREEIILTPNQEVVYNTINENFSKKIVANPVLILAKPTLFEMTYDATPVDTIFKVMEANYGIDIVYDEDVLATCSITTSMAEEGLYERMEIICQAIGAQYEIKDAAILVRSTGCQ